MAGTKPALMKTALTCRGNDLKAKFQFLLPRPTRPKKTKFRREIDIFPRTSSYANIRCIVPLKYTFSSTRLIIEPDNCSKNTYKRSTIVMIFIFQNVTSPGNTDAEFTEFSPLFFSFFFALSFFVSFFQQLFSVCLCVVLMVPPLWGDQTA